MLLRGSFAAPQPQNTHKRTQKVWESRVDPIEIAYHGGINGLFESPSTGGRLIPERLCTCSRGQTISTVRLYADTVEEYVLASALLHFCQFEEDLGSEVVFCIDE